MCAQQDAVLQEIAASGESKYEWAALKPLLASKVEQACREYYETSQDIDESKNGDTFDAVLKRTGLMLLPSTLFEGAGDDRVRLTYARDGQVEKLARWRADLVANGVS